MTATVASCVVQTLADLGVEHAFGVSGGGIVPVWAELVHSGIHVHHCRHESGAAFAAVEAFFQSGRPTVVFTTTGPGITNVLTGLFAARRDGAKVVLLSPASSPSHCGRGAFQETSAYTFPKAGLFEAGPLFHQALTLTSVDELPLAMMLLSQGLGRRDGYVAHLNIPINLQTAQAVQTRRRSMVGAPNAFPDPKLLSDCADALAAGSFAIWLGHGARDAAKEIRMLAERTASPVFTSPRAKGIFPEDHSLWIGVTGFLGHASVIEYMRTHHPSRILVLGSALGEPTSSWDPLMVPEAGFIHVDLDATVPGRAYPDAPCVPIICDVQSFVSALLERMPNRPRKVTVTLPRPELHPIALAAKGLVRPEALMQVIQRVVVDGCDAPVLADAGNSAAWAVHSLRFKAPRRFRLTTFGSMGHAASGVLGAALARRGKAFAVVGDGAMLMLNEISTAVSDTVSAVWIVLNDARYGMIEQGLANLGVQGLQATIPPVDFRMLARAIGADGVRVERESDLESAIALSLAARGPFVVDVVIDRSDAPFMGRVKSLLAQGVRDKTAEGKERG